MTANPFAHATAWSLLETISARHGAREAIVFGDERLSFTDLRDRARAFAGGLETLGLGRGDALAIWRRDVIVHLRVWKLNLVAPIIEPVISVLGFGLGIGALVGGRELLTGRREAGEGGQHGL